MLKPKKKIAIVYGHKREILDFIRDKILEYGSQGYRVQPIILTSKELRIKKGLIYQTFTELFQDIDAAIVFMTNDDVGISKKELETITNSGLTPEVVSHLKGRARQNVIFELGYIAARVGEGNYRVFADESVEIPSDIQGKYLERNFEQSNIAEITKELIEENLQIQKRSLPIEDDTYRLDYSDLQQNKDSMLELFEHEYSQFEDDGDKLIYLFERIVFDSYYQRPEWWQEKFKTLSSVNPKVSFGKNLLEEITRYMRSWMPPETKNYNMIYSCAGKLRDLLNEIEKYKPINPVVKIVSYNYLGLACHKMGKLNKLEKDKRLEYLNWSKEALETTIDIANTFDDPLLPLWQGYATFNLARTLNEIDNLEPNKNMKILWREVFATAIDIREGWTRQPYYLPVEIEEGLSTEYLHAKAERIRRAKIDDQNNLIEVFPYEVDEKFIDEAEQEYQKWEKDPKQIRVRLAKNLHESWGIIKERFKRI